MYTLASVGSNSLITAGFNNLAYIQSASNELRVNGNIRFSGNLFQGNNVFTSGGGSGGSVSSSGVIVNAGHLVPSTNDTFDLGTTTQRWKNLYLSGNAISFGNGIVIDSFNWNYMVNYVIPAKELQNPTPRILHDGVAGDHSAYIQGGNLYVFGRNDRGQLGLGDTSNRAVPTLHPTVSNALAVACGDGFTIVLRTNLTAVGFGTNSQGQLCQPGTSNHTSPVIIPGLSNAIQVSAGDSHALYLLNNGMVVGAGNDGNGQLGDNATAAYNNTLTPMILPANSGATDSNAPRFVSCGSFHSAVLMNNGSMYVCGNNSDGQLAASPGTLTQASMPGVVAGASNLVRVACGERHTVAIMANGGVIGFGRNAEGQLGLNSTVATITAATLMIAPTGGMSGLAMAVDAGRAHTVVAMSNGDVRVAGANNFGQLGIGAANPSGTIAFTTLAGLSAFNVAAGRNHTIVLRNNSIVFPENQILSFGDNQFGQAGDGQLGVFSSLPAPTLMIRWFPNAISEVRNSRLAIRGGNRCSAYVDADNVAYTFGWGGSGRLGLLTLTDTIKPTPLSTIQSNIVDIAMSFSGSHTIALDSLGRIWGFGWNGDGQIAQAISVGSATVVPTLITGGTPGIQTRTIVAIAAGTSHTIALDSLGRIWGFGSNGSSQIANAGSGTGIPVLITGNGIENRTIVAIAAGSSHTIALDSTGRIWGFGSNGSGQIANATSVGTNTTTPTLIAGGTPGIETRIIIAISAGVNHTVALDSTGRIWGFGTNANGQIANANSNTGVPALLAGGSPTTIESRTIVAISAGGSYTIALDSTGRIWGFGANGNSQLTAFGGGSTPAMLSGGSPVTIESRTIVAIAAGITHTLALDSSGNIWGFGNNDSGQLANTSTLGGNTAVPAIITSTVRSLAPKIVSTGIGSHKLLQNRTQAPFNLLTTQIQVTGVNTFSQLGNNSTTTVTVPATLGMTFPAAVIASATGTSHSAVVLSTGALWTWGRNDVGQCGFGSAGSPVTTPTATTLTTVSGIALGEDFTLALRSDGTVFATGNNNNGKLGIASVTVGTSINTFTVIPALTNVTQIAAGQHHAAAVLVNGTVMTWGANAAGQTGLGTSSGDTTVPTAVTSIPALGSLVACGRSHTVVITREVYPRVFTCGDNQFGQLGRSTNFGTTTANPSFGEVIFVDFTRARPDGLACGTQHTIIHFTSNVVRIFGRTNTLVAGAVGDAAWQPYQIGLPGVGFHVVDIAAGDDSTYLEYENGTVRAFNATQPFGRQAVMSTSVHTQSHTLVLNGNGRIWGFGNNGNGQTANAGDFTSTPTLLTGGSPYAIENRTIVAVSAGSNHTIALDSTGRIWGFGSSAAGQGANASGTVPILITGGSPSIEQATIVAIAASANFTVVLDSTGRMWGFGSNSTGQLATLTNNSSIPARITGNSIQNHVIVAIATGSAFTIALDSTGRIWGFGNNGNGQIANVTSIGNFTGTPGLISGNSIESRTIVAIAAGSFHTIALDSTGRIWGFGTNGNGRIANATTLNNDTAVPALISGGSPTTIESRTIVAISAGNAHTIALDSTGRIWGFGTNGSGQIANAGSSTGVPTLLSGGSPTAIESRTIVAISAGNNHTLAMDSLGRVWGFGNNDSSQLANVTSNTPTPTLITGITVSALNVVTPIAFINFTGQHRCYIKGYTPKTLLQKVGLIVSASTNEYATGSVKGKSLVTINESLPIVELSKVANDKRVFGVISLDLNDTAFSGEINYEELQKLIEEGDTRAQINSLGEGGIWIVDESGPIESGDYITTSSVPGYGMRQQSPTQLNYTVAKATMDCDFVVHDEYVYVHKLDANGAAVLDEITEEPLWEVQTDPVTAAPVTKPTYKMRYLNANGQEVPEAEALYKAAFIGCTYHCG